MRAAGGMCWRRRCARINLRCLDSRVWATLRPHQRQTHFCCTQEDIDHASGWRDVLASLRIKHVKSAGSRQP